MRKVGFWLVIAVALGIASVAHSGHEFPIYPSYYPHLISIATMPPERAATELIAGRIQAYVGAQPAFAGAIPEAIKPIESLGSLVVVRVNPDSPRAKDRSASCALIGGVMRDIERHRSGFTFHPYPITPFDGDYLYHADLAEAARTRVAHLTAPTVEIRPRMRDSAWRASGDAWDVAIDEVDADALVASSLKVAEGAMAPPWRRSGWYRTLLLIEPAIDDVDRAASIRGDVARLTSGGATEVERINAERELVSLLAQSCRAVVAGYTVRREYVNTDYSAGIENIGFDSITGLDSPIFIRTAKLKDFPWNGILSLGVASKPTAAWNPIAGFTDPFGRLMWSAIGDAAIMPSPNGPGFLLNRTSDVK
ncbi:MAG TPA: hypothetical protein VJ891_16245 [Casimicrobiaceae bacterium]|nr:hypothetical protein [Casimicrobiaceae bacterium]